MDATWSVRLPDEMKEKLSALITESGLNAKDFIAQIMQAYELNMVKKVQPLISADVEELSLLTSRINSLFINIGERVTNFQQQHDDEFQTKIAEKDGMIMLLESRIKDIEDQLNQKEQEEDELRKEYEELTQKNKQITEVSEVNKALVLEYREKNNNLNGLLGKQKELQQQLDALMQSLVEEKSLSQAAQAKLLEKEREMEHQKELFEEQKKMVQSHFQQKHDESDIGKQKEILALKIEHQKTLEILQQQYADKIRELLLRLEELQMTKTQRKPSPAKIPNK